MKRLALAAISLVGMCLLVAGVALPPTVGVQQPSATVTISFPPTPPFSIVRGEKSISPHTRVSSSTLPAPVTTSSLEPFTRPEVLILMSAYHDWDPVLMTQLAFCESTWRSWAINPQPVILAGVIVHSSGLLGVLGGSLDPVTTIAQAHALYETQGLGAWEGDFRDGCAYERSQ